MSYLGAVLMDRAPFCSGLGGAWVGCGFLSPLVIVAASVPGGVVPGLWAGSVGLRGCSAACRGRGSQGVRAVPALSFRGAPCGVLGGDILRRC